MEKKLQSKKINIGNLIEEIGPLNNKIRMLDGWERLSLMWDIGDIFFRHGIRGRIHPIAWEIQHKSYITRDLVSYCFRIRRKWPDKAILYELFHSLKSYSTFREALPLIENEKYILSEAEVKEIIKWLNGDDIRRAKEEIRKLKKQYIDKKNDRARRLIEVEEEAECFNNFFNYIKKMVMEENKEEIKKIKSIGNDKLLKLAQVLLAISNDNYSGPPEVNKTSNSLVNSIINSLLPISLAKKEKKARFRRLVSSKCLIDAADILISIRNDEGLDQIKKRLGW